MSRPIELAKIVLIHFFNRYNHFKTKAMKRKKKENGQQVKANQNGYPNQDKSRVDVSLLKLTTDFFSENSNRKGLRLANNGQILRSVNLYMREFPNINFQFYYCSLQ